MRLLLIDTCGDVGSVALGDGDRVVAAETLPLRGASTALLPAVGRMLAGQGWLLQELDGMGVVSGPGSFTGVRVGLAAAKGLCEAAGLRLAGVSRLAMLAEAAQLKDGYAALDAGRGELYVREVRGGALVGERLCRVDDLRDGGRVVVAEERLLERLRERMSASLPELCAISAGDALALTSAELASGLCEAAALEANYVRAEADIYPRAAVEAVAGRAGG